MTRPAASEWSVLDLNSDPVPGDPQTYQEITRAYRNFADTAQNAHDLLASGGRIDDGQGKAMDAFRNLLGQFPSKLDQMAQSYRQAVDAYNRYLPSLEEAQSMSLRALDQARQANQDQTSANAALNAAQNTLNTLKNNPNPTQHSNATSDASAAQNQLNDAQQGLDQAKSLLNQATALRDQAANQAIQALNDAASEAPQESIWQKIAAFFEAIVHFLTSTIMQWITTALDAIAAIASFIPGIGTLISTGLGLLSSGIQIIGAAVSGNSNSLGMAVGGLALSFVPGGRLAGDIAKTATGAVKSGVKAATNGVKDGGKTIGGKIPGVATPGGKLAGAAKGAAGGAGNLGRQLGKKAGSFMPWAKKPTCGDPIDIDSGRMLLPQTDVELDGTLPLVLSRTHISSHRHGLFFGPSWASTLDQCLEVDDEGVYFASEDGLTVPYPHPEPGAPVLPVVGPRWPLERSDDGAYMITDPDDGRTLRFAQYDALWLLASIADRNGNRIDFTYDDTGLPLEISHSGGYRIRVETKDRLVTGLHLRDADDGADIALMRYGYRDQRLTEVINESGQPMLFEYDPEGQITGWTDRNGVQYRYTYDAEGRCVRTEGSGGFMNGTLTYDTDNGVTYVTDSLGHRTAYHLNHSGQIIRQVDPLGAETVTEWDEFDLLLSQTDPLGRTTRYEYDETGNLTAVRRPDGSQIQIAYNELRQPVTVTAPDGTVTCREYDERGNLMRTVDPAGAATSYEYDDHGHLVSVTDALGNTLRVDTNAAGLPTAINDPLDATTRYERDAFGRVVALTGPVGGVTRFGWTIDGKPAWRTLPDGTAERWLYDAEGNLHTHIDALGQRTRTEVTHFDLPSAEVRPDGTRLEFGYDTELRLTSVTNEQGLVWRYDYDAVGNLVSETDFNDRTLTYRHDAARQLIARTNGAGETTQFSHDTFGNVIERRSGDAVATFTYDVASRLVEAANADARVTFDRDPLGRVLAETINGRTLTSTYDALGRRICRVTPSGARSDWEYDASDNPIALHTAGRTIRFEHDPAGREIQRFLGNDAVLAQEWDGNHQLKSQALIGRGGRRTQQRVYSYRADGFLARIADQLAGNRTIDLDQVGRVTAVQGSVWTERYAYDAAGNITNATWPALAESSDSEALGEREYSGTLIRRAGGVRYEHDAQGRVVLRQHKRLSQKPATWRYFWDADDRLTQVLTPDGSLWRYRHDPLGRRVAKQRLTRDGLGVLEEVLFTWDGSILAEQTHLHRHPDTPGSGDLRVTVWDYKPGTFRPVTQHHRAPLRHAPQQWIDEQFYSIVTDLIGTPAELIDDQGGIAWHQHTTLWGRTIDQPDADAYIPLRFPGQYADPETGLYYNYYRHYDPAAGRYSSTDPLGLDAGPNPFAYVPNPTREIDPFGLAGNCGGAAPVWQGQAGVQQSIAAAQTRGETVIGEEITIHPLGAANTVRVDIAVRDANGNLKFIDAKNGPHARLTKNQRVGYPLIRTQGGVPLGPRATQANLTPGQPIGPTPVQIDHW